eukprot:GSChrysophyteH1.ASY1.ANO1.1983.1 assembled CDS
MNSFFAAFLVACIVAMVAGECPSGCSGHGTCGAYDGCSCFRNWMSNDCSERICPFGLAHQFPAMKDSRGNALKESAHYYRECSNKGICDRSSGECECFEGYEGSSCQRASCPSSGNGHGTCHTIQELAAYDHENVYRLWDEDITMGCKCDAGYTGPDCSSRTCKMGYDPLYYDDFQNVRYANYTVQFYVMNDDAVIYGNYSLVFTDVYGEDWETEPIDIDANCGVIQDRLETLPNDVIPWGTVKCFKSEAALHLFGGNGQAGSIHKASGQFAPQWKDYMQDESIADADDDEARGETIYSYNHYAIVNKFILAFPGNPGEIPPLKINRYLDGARPTLFSTETGEQTLGVHIYANGFHGETTDYVNDECEGVLISSGTPKILKKCLGDSDGVSTNNVEVYDWDYGSFMNPHLIKLVDATQDRFVEYLRSDGSSYKASILAKPVGDPGPTNLDYNRGSYGWCRALDPPGFFAVVYFDDCSPFGTGFRVLTRPATDYATTTRFHVFTTKGTLQQVSAHSGAYTHNVIHTTNTTWAGAQGQVDCETALDSNGDPLYSNYDCLNKGDKIFLIALGTMDTTTANSLMANPLYPNMYTVEKIGKEVKNPNAADQTNLGELHAEAYRQQITLNMGVNAQYMKHNDDADSDTNTNFPGVLATIYKFHPPALNSTGTTGYNYVGECSNRGICDSDSGVCECFAGYTGQNCGVINSLAE